MARTSIPSMKTAVEACSEIVSRRPLEHSAPSQATPAARTTGSALGPAEGGPRGPLCWSLSLQIALQEARCMYRVHTHRNVRKHMAP